MFERNCLDPTYKTRWRCEQHRLRLKICIDDENENVYTVIRRPANEVKVNDCEVYREGHGLAGSGIAYSYASGNK